MPVVKCPNCGTPINVVEKKTGLWWGIGCLVAALGLPSIVVCSTHGSLTKALESRDMRR